MATPDCRLPAELTELIRAAFDVDAPDYQLEVPPHLNDFAKACFGWRSTDAALAKMIFDSVTDEVVGARGVSSEQRTFRFGALGTEVYVALTDASITVIVDKQESLPVRIFSRAAHGTERVSLTTDEFGECTAPVPVLPARVEIDLPVGTVTTPWIVG